MTDHVFLASDLRPEPARYGGKASHLIELMQMPGIAVPSPAVISVGAFERFFAAYPALQQARQRLAEGGLPDTTLRRARLLREGIEVAALPKMLAEEVVQAVRQLKCSGGVSDLRIAVRSSASCEDSRQLSFAGQFATFLNVPGEEQIVARVRDVWASAFGANPVSYQRRLGRNPADVQMAVILQPMIDARAAGTAFNVDLETGLPFISINAVRGLGELEVSGQATPETWIVDGETWTVLKRRPGSQMEEYHTDSSAGSTRDCAVRCNKPSYALDPSEVKRLAKTTKQIAEHFRRRGRTGHIDVEYAFDANGKLFILQARPETVYSQRRIPLTMIDKTRAKAMRRLISGGVTGSPGVAVGRLCVVDSVDDAKGRADRDAILVTRNTTNVWESVLERCRGAVTSIGGAGSHTALVLREQGKPALVGVQGAVERLRNWDGEQVSLDATGKRVYLGEVPQEWLCDAGELQPTYGGRDEQTEAESWREATDTGQTVIDSEGRGWIGKPKYAVSRFNQHLYQECHEEVARRLQSPVEAQLQQGVFRVLFSDIFQWRRRFRSMPLEELEHWHRWRVAAVDRYRRACRRFALTPRAFLEWWDASVQLNASMGVAYDIYRVTEGLLEEQLAERKLPEPYHSQIRSTMGALLVGRSLAAVRADEYQRLLKLLRRDPLAPSLLRVGARTGRHDDMAKVARQLASRIRGHALAYKQTPTTDPPVPPEEAVRIVAQRLRDDLQSRNPRELPNTTPEEYFPEDERFQRIARLAFAAEQLRQDSHHVKVAGWWPVRERLLEIAPPLQQRGEIERAEGVFDHSPDFLFREIIHRHVAKQLNRFFEYEIEVPSPPESLTLGLARRLSEFGFQFFYLPAVSIEQAVELGGNSHWKYPLGARFWETEIVERRPIPGRWVAVEVAEISDVAGSESHEDQLLAKLGEVSRLRCWDDVQEHMLPKAADCLSVERQRLRLPHALEWNFLGNLLRSSPLDKGRAPINWGRTAAWEWTQGNYGRFHRLIVGKHGAEGLDGLQAVGWLFSGDQWFNPCAFRLLLEL